MKKLLAIYSRLYRYVQPYKTRYIIALLITLPIGAMDGVIAWAIKPFMDEVLMERDLQDLMWVPLLIVLFNVIQGGLRYYETYLDEYLAQKVTMGMRKDLFLKLQRMAMTYFHEQASGMLGSRYFMDPGRVQQALIITLRVLLTKSITTVTLVAVMLYHSWKLALVATTILSLVVLPVALIRKRLMNLANQEVETSSRLLSILNETFYGIKILLSFNALPYQNKRFDRAQLENHHQIMKMAQVKGLMAPITHTITAVGVAIIVWYGSYLVIMKEMTTGALISFVVALIMIYRPLKTLGSTAVEGQKALASAQRIFEILDDPNELITQPRSRVFQEVKKEIRLKDVWFRYDDQSDWILKGVNLTIPRKETIALVGSSGGGKTTLVELLMGFYPDYRGEVTIDDTPLNDYTFTSLSAKIAYVNQDTMLFDTTLYENILVGNIKATEEQVRQAVKSAYLSEWVDTLPLGLQTPIGERGIKLSGGQRQRLAIARAILKNAPVLILDEATSALDHESEAAIQKTLVELVKDRTVLIIAHRLSTIQAADRILVLENGHIVEEGSHQDLLNVAEGSYRKLFQAQYHTAQALSS